MKKYIAHLLSRISLGRKSVLVASLGLCFAFIGIFFFLKYGKQTAANWYDDGLLYRQPINFTHNAAITTPRAITVTLDTLELLNAGLIQSDCDDIRFTDISGQPLQYQMTGSCSSGSNTFEVVFPSIINGGNAGYVYYGSASATSKSQSVGAAALTPNGGDPIISDRAAEEQSPGPAVYYGFDEGTGTTAYDSSDTRADATLTSGPVWKPESDCIRGKCLFFDGSNDYTNVTAPSSVKSTTRTVSFWIRPINFDTSQGVVTLAGSNYYVGIGTNGRIIEAHQDSLSSQVTSFSKNNSLTLNNWQHVTTVTVTSGTAVNVSYYVNGQFIETDSDTGGHGTTFGSSMRVGRISSASVNFFEGYVDEVKIYPYARSADQIRQEYTSRGSIHGTSAQLGNANIQQILSDGLVGHWKLDESASPSLDSSGVGNTGVWNGNVATTTGKFGNGATFDGTDDYISVADNSSLDVNSTATFATWFKLDTLPSSNAHLIDKWTETGNQRSYQMYVTSANKLAVDISSDGTSGNSITVTSTSTISANTWYHAAATMSGSQVILYINGTPEPASGTISGIFQSTAILSLGADNAGTTNEIDGVLDDVRIYNRAFTTSEVHTLYNFAPSPIGHWKFDENTGTSTLTDSSTNDFSGTLSGFTEESWQPGKFGSALSFDGTTSSISVASENSTLSRDNYTLAAWIQRRTDSGAVEIILDNRDGSNDGQLMQISATDKIECYYNSTASVSTTSIATGRWYHVACSSSGSTQKLYINGAVEDSDSISGSISESTDLRIGGRSFTSAITLFPGKLDDIRIYNYERSSGQIVEDMNAGHPLGGSPVGSPARYYKFDEGYGTTVYDSSLNLSNASLGTGASAPTWSNDGKFGKALSFDGTNDLVQLASATGLPSGTAPQTISVWYKATANPSGASQYDDFVTLQNSGSSSSITLGLDGPSGQLRAWKWGNVSLVSTTAPSAGSWNYAAYTYDGTTNKLYLNGQLVASSTTAPNSAAPNAGYIGNWSGANEGAYGLLDEVKIYNTALTPEQVLIDYNRGKTITLGSTSTGVGGSAPDNSAARKYCPPGDTATCNAPIGEWLFDENTGDVTTYDTSGNGLNGTIDTSMTESNWVPGQHGSALGFDGSDDVVTISDNALINMSTAATWTGWIYIRESASSAARSINFLDKWTTAGNAKQYEIFQGSSNDKLGLHLSTDGINTAVTTSSDNALSTNRWYHFAYVFDGTNSYLYMDGIKQADVDPISSINTTGTDVLTFGSSKGTDFWSNSILDEFRIYNYARTPAQVMWEYNKGAPVAHYKLDECQGPTAYNNVRIGNNSAAGNNGTITIGAGGSNTSVGTCTGASTEAWKNGAVGKINSSLNFDGTNDYVSVTDPTLGEYDFNDTDFSLTGWFYRDTATTDDVILAKRNGDASTDTGYLLYLDDSTDKLVFEVSDGTDEYSLTSSSSFTSTGWYHYAVVWDDDSATNSEIYINGIDDGATDTGTIGSIGDISNAVALRLGDVSDGVSALTSHYYDGSLDEIRIYNYALTPIQIKNIYNNGAVSFK